MVAIKLAVPKRIGGVKIPKPLRERLKKLAQSKSGRAAISEALVAAGGTLAIAEVKGTDAAAPKSAAKSADKAPSTTKRASRPRLASTTPPTGATAET
jgi:hypothetical protein